MFETSKSYTDIFNHRGHNYNEAGSLFPMARENERAALLDRLKNITNGKVIDAPAGGGYVAEGLEKKQPHLEIICVEPAVRFAEVIPDRFQTIHEPIEKTSLPDQSIDAVLSLAGLHHLNDKSLVFTEWFRLLKSAGQIVVADVGEGTPTASFLNGFVNQYTPGGHDGQFFSEGEFSSLMEDAGFTSSGDEMVDVPWVFSDEPSMVAFCRQLFSVDPAPESELLNALNQVGVSDHKLGVQLHWQLYYAHGSK